MLKKHNPRAPPPTPRLPPPAAVAGALTYKAWIGWQAGIARMPHAVLGLLSAGMTLFLVYNVLAGGNPPPKGTH